MPYRYKLDTPDPFENATRSRIPTGFGLLDNYSRYSPDDTKPGKTVRRIKKKRRAKRKMSTKSRKINRR
jgi:hypothetical protein